MKNSVINVAMSGSIIPTPFATPTIDCVARPTADVAIFGTVSVVMIAARHRLDVGERQRRRDRGEAGADAVHRVLPSDHAGRRDRDVAGEHAERGGDAVDDLPRVRQPGRAGRDVRVLGDHDDGLGAPVGDGLAADDDARAGEAAPREHAARDAARVGRDDDEVLAVVLDPDVGDVGAEAPEGSAGHQSTRPRALRFEAGAHLAECCAEGPDLVAVEVVEEVSCARRHVIGRGRGDRVEALRRDRREHHPAVLLRRLPADEAVADEAVEPPREARTARAAGAGEVAHPHVPVLGLGQVDEHLVVAERQTVRREIERRAAPGGRRRSSM